MKTAAGPETLAVNGEPLRQAREARGLSIPEMAAVVTLSREQVRALEDGGNLPFYTAAHKLLALRKYAGALAIPVESLLSDTTAPADTASPLPSATPDVTDAADGTLRLRAVERTAQLRRQILLTLIAAAILLAIYAKWRGTTDSTPTDAPAPVASASAEAAAVEQVSPPPPAPSPVGAEAAPPSAEKPAAAMVADGGAAEPAECAIKNPADPPSWTPAYQRKQDIRLFIVSRSTAELCVTDAAGNTARLSLKPSAGQSFAGKPPYLVYSERLPSMEIYLQGMRARIPADARLLRLVPSRVPAPATAGDGAAGG